MVLSYEGFDPGLEVYDTLTMKIRNRVLFLVSKGLRQASKLLSVSSFWARVLVVTNSVDGDKVDSCSLFSL